MQTVDHTWVLTPQEELIIFWWSTLYVTVSSWERDKIIELANCMNFLHKVGYKKKHIYNEKLTLLLYRQTSLMKYFEQKRISRCKNIDLIFTGCNKHSSILQTEITPDLANEVGTEHKQDMVHKWCHNLSPILKRNADFVFSMATGSKGQLPDPSSCYWNRSKRKEICEKKL